MEVIEENMWACRVNESMIRVMEGRMGMIPVVVPI